MVSLAIEFAGMHRSAHDRRRLRRLHRQSCVGEPGGIVRERVGATLQTSYPASSPKSMCASLPMARAKSAELRGPRLERGAHTLFFMPLPR